MATAVASKPSAPHQTKMKRPPLPAVQTNGIHSSQSSPSPLMSSKRPPSGFKAPPTPTLNSASTTVSGVQPRLSQRRKDSQRPGEAPRGRPGKDGVAKTVKRRPEPYVKTQGYILKKYRGQLPSLIIHLHPTNFRFDQQPGSFSYNSPMKVVLEHIRSQTVPHDMIEELMNAGIKFYEGCLIVQVKDHRATKIKNSASTSDPTETNIPSSIHDYEQWVTPSPYVPFPEQKRSEANHRETSATGAQSSSSKEEKTAEPKTYTVVLFPTAQSIQEETWIQANTPDIRQGNRRTQGANVPRTPASGTVPPTPISAIPPTPSASGPPSKRQKMSISGPEVQAFESKIIAATASPLFLEPISNLEQSHALLESMTGPLNRGKRPLPKTRKRTVAELAADERIAAQEQAFMLIMDERANTTGKAASKDEDGAAPFEPSFETFNAIQNIKTEHEEKARLKAQKQQRNEQLQQQQEQQQQQLRANQVNRAQREHLERQKQEAERQAHMRRQQELQAMRRQNQPNVGHPQMNGAMPNGYPQGPHSPPMQRNGTPHSNPSPTPNNMMGPQLGGVPMQHTSSGQGSSPGRPPSSMARQGHPGAAVQMLREQSRQNPSRTSTPPMNGTPHMASVTPNIPHSTPVMPQGTPVPRMSQASPPNVMPTSMSQPINIPAGMPPEQQQHLLRERERQQHMHAQTNQMRNYHQQAAFQQQQQQMQHNGQMSPQGQVPHNLQQQQRIAEHQRQQALRQQAIQNGQINGMQAYQNMPNGASPGIPQQRNPGAGQPGQQQPNGPRPIAQVPQQQGNLNMQQRQRQVIQSESTKVANEMVRQAGLQDISQLSQQQKQQAQAMGIQSAKEILSRYEQSQRHQELMRQQQAALENAKRNIPQRPGGMPMGAQGMPGLGNPQMGQMRQNGPPQMSREMVAQMQQMQQMQNQGLGMNMNSMGGLNGMNGMQ